MVIDVKSSNSDNTSVWATLAGSAAALLAYETLPAASTLTPAVASTTAGETALALLALVEWPVVLTVVGAIGVVGGAALLADHVFGEPTHAQPAKGRPAEAGDPDAPTTTKQADPSAPQVPDVQGHPAANPTQNPTQKTTPVPSPPTSDPNEPAVPDDDAQPTGTEDDDHALIGYRPKAEAAADTPSKPPPAHPEPASAPAHETAAPSSREAANENASPSSPVPANDTKPPLRWYDLPENAPHNNNFWQASYFDLGVPTTNEARKFVVREGFDPLVRDILDEGVGWPAEDPEHVALDSPEMTDEVRSDYRERVENVLDQIEVQLPPELEAVLQRQPVNVNQGMPESTEVIERRDFLLYLRESLQDYLTRLVPNAA